MYTVSFGVILWLETGRKRKLKWSGGSQKHNSDYTDINNYNRRKNIYNIVSCSDILPFQMSKEKAPFQKDALGTVCSQEWSSVKKTLAHGKPRF